jgi:hypothetical protein
VLFGKQATKVKTKAEKERLQTIAEMPCYACFQDGVETQSRGSPYT